MALPQPLVGQDLVTVEQFYRLVEDGQKADLIDGVIYLASPDSTRNNQIVNFLSFLGPVDELFVGAVVAQDSILVCRLGPS